LDTLKEEEIKHTTALCEGQSRRSIGPPAKPKAPIFPPSKTSKTTNEHEVEDQNPQTPEKLTVKTSKTPEPTELGLVATWSAEFGYVSLHDPTTGEWHDLKTSIAPEWAVGEARKRKELYKSGNRRAYRLSARDMEDLWKSDQPPEEGIVEDYPVEGE
jgi:hypothetical protein